MQMFLKPAHVGLGTAYHQDNGYFGISDPLKGTGMWIAVDPATEVRRHFTRVAGAPNPPRPSQKSVFLDKNYH